MLHQPHPRILFINRVYPPARGTSARVLRDLAHGFAEAGWDVTVLCAGQRSVQLRDGDVNVVRVHTTSRKTAFGFFRVWVSLLIAALRLEKTDVVVTLTDPPLLVTAGRVIAQIKGAKHLHWCQDVYPDLAPLVGLNLPRRMMTYLSQVSRRSMTSCDKVVAVGRCMARHLVQTGVQSSRVTIIPNWPEGFSRPLVTANVKATAPANDDSDDMMLKDKTPKFRVLYSGTLSRVHPISTILEAASLLQSQHTDVEFLFMGEGPAHERIAVEKARLGLENVKLLPPQPDDVLPEFLANADVHLISLKDEAAGMIVPARVYAAFAAGRPSILIGPAQSEAAQVIEEFKAGTIVPQGRADLLARAIATYRTESDAWFQAHQGAQKAATIYRHDRAIQNWIARTKDILKNVA
jgi:colanic acid biosynthesis glycosyl transferase WcaI